MPVRAEGIVYVNGASTFENESHPLELVYNHEILLEETDEGLFISLHMDEKIIKMKNQVVTSEWLGEALISGQAFVNPDDSKITIDKDFLGNTRDRNNPTPGPFEKNRGGMQKFKVWEFAAEAD